MCVCVRERERERDLCKMKGESLMIGDNDELYRDGRCNRREIWSGVRAPWLSDFVKWFLEVC